MYSDMMTISLKGSVCHGATALPENYIDHEFFNKPPSRGHALDTWPRYVFYQCISTAMNNNKTVDSYIGEKRLIVCLFSVRLTSTHH
jgi:hypothetical protein